MFHHSGQQLLLPNQPHRSSSIHAYSLFSLTMSWLLRSATVLGAVATLILRTCLTNAEITPGARHLTIDELNGLLATETRKEFGRSADTREESAALWQHAVVYEWNKAARAEDYNGQKYPYAICHMGQNMSGYKRKLAIASELNYTTEDIHLRTIYNSQDYYCVYGQFVASLAANVTGDDFIVQPVLPSLKFMESSVDALQQMQAGYSITTLEANLCPGVAMASENHTASNDEQAMVDWIIGKLVPETLADPISDEYYLTSEEYHNVTESDGEKATERAELWKGLLNEYQESGVCAETFKTRLTWSLERAKDAETGNSQATIQFNNTGNSTQDRGCVLTLTLAIAAHPNVCSLDLRREVSTQNIIAQWITQSELENERPFFDSGLDGTGQVVSVSDTGIDVNNCYFLDNEQSPGLSKVNSLARKVVQYIPFVDDGDYKYGHGTHVAGTIAGKRSDGGGAAEGAAPGAKLAFFDIGDSSGALTLPPDSSLLEVGRPDSHIHSMSWGAEFNFYTSQARNFDQFMYENDDFLILVAAGNSGGGDAANSVGSPATAKNVIAIGAHHSYGTSNPRGGLGPAYISDFSSRGPTSDGRTKPDIVAVGQSLLSAGALPDEFGECDPSNGKIPGANDHDEGLLSLQGTSMATPLTAGTAAIIRQYFEEGYYPTGVKGEGSLTNPSATLIKAVLMNGAQFMKGVDNGSSGVTPVEPYDSNQGFGHLSLQNSIYLPGKTNVQLQAYDRESVIDGLSQTYDLEIDTSGGCTSKDLSVTLVWSEEASRLSTFFSFVNIVTLGGVTYYPNGLGQPDRRNNAERVIISEVMNKDVATITVTAFNLARYEQKYSLVATGCFGGVANQLFASGQCSVFECDNSKNERIRTILLCILIPLGVIILSVVVRYIWKRKSERRNEDESDNGDSKRVDVDNGNDQHEDQIRDDTFDQ
eukprot:CCRYP_002444-RC/>CCRYP_002444-RC protein AED:0.08 eAED:0.08 QI:101/0.77/0.6/1/0.77/0.7/10/144/934